MLEEKIDKLTAIMERVCVAMEGGAAAPAAKTAAKTAPKATAAKKPKTTADQLKAKFSELKSNADIGVGPLKEIISGVGCENLAELLVTPDKYDEAMEAMTTLETETGSGAGDDDEL